MNARDFTPPHKQPHLSHWPGRSADRQQYDQRARCWWQHEMNCPNPCN